MGIVLFHICLAGLFFSGIVIISLGFKISLREKRLADDTPTTKVSEIKKGLVKLYGKAEPLILLRSPFTKTECVYYKYIIQEFVGGKTPHYKEVASDNTSSCPFLLNDGTGKILVFPSNAEIKFFQILNYLLVTDKSHKI